MFPLGFLREKEGVLVNVARGATQRWLWAPPTPVSRKQIQPIAEALCFPDF